MPSNWTGTVEERFARLDNAGRRCDGNSRRCTHNATASYLLAPARDGVAIEGTAPVTKQACSRHVQQFVSSAAYVVLTTKRMAPRPDGQPHPYTPYFEDGQA